MNYHKIYVSSLHVLKQHSTAMCLHVGLSTDATCHRSVTDRPLTSIPLTRSRTDINDVIAARLSAATIYPHSFSVNNTQ